MKLCVCIMGGTIDSFFDPKTDGIICLDESSLPNYFNTIKLATPVDFISICMKDSRALQVEDLNTLLDTIKTTNHDGYLVTHGTYTMPDTARFLKHNLGDNHNKKVILTGSMIPITGFTPSDAGFNIGYAFAKLESIDSGVYVAMNGRVFDADEVSKLISDGRFVSLFNK